MRFVPSLTAIGGVAILAAAPAFAHAFLQSSTPPVGATVSAAPAEIRVIFTEDVEPAFSKLTVQNGQGADVTAGALHAIDATTLARPVKTLQPGTYRVAWHVTSTDAHKSQGTFSFTVSH